MFSPSSKSINNLGCDTSGTHTQTHITHMLHRARARARRRVCRVSLGARACCLALSAGGDLSNARRSAVRQTRS
jgi:hypothetical protein